MLRVYTIGPVVQIAASQALSKAKGLKRSMLLSTASITAARQGCTGDAPMYHC